MHLGKDPMSFKFRKDLIEERQRENTKYKVRITVNLGSLIALNRLNPGSAQDATAGDRELKAGGRQPLTS